MLRACRRLLRPGGRTAFYTIHVARGLAASPRRRARAAGPPAIASRRDHRALLESAGFVDLEEVDVTAAYRLTLLGWYERWSEYATELEALVTEEVFSDRQQERRRTLAALDEGLLRRSLFTAMRPVERRRGFATEARSSRPR